MKKILKRTLATFLVVLMLLTSAPLQGFVELEWPELSLPSVGQWFSGKASAADEKLTAEEAVDIFMANKSVWMIPDYYMTGGLGCYFFIDLDFDGVLELLISSTSGTGNFSSSRFYRIKNNDIVEFDSDYKDSGGNAFGGPDFTWKDTLLYKNKTTGIYYYYCENSDRAGWFQHGTSENMFNLFGTTVKNYKLFWISSEKDFDNPSADYVNHYWIMHGTKREVSKSEYDRIRNDFFKNYIDLNLVKKDVDAKKFASSS